MTSTFKQTIYDYINIDNEIQSLEEKLEELRNNKSELEDNIISFIKEKQLIGKNIKVGNDTIRYSEGTIKSPLTHTILHSSLNKYFFENYSGKMTRERCEAKAKEMFDYILNCREDKDKSVLKRLPNN